MSMKPAIQVETIDAFDSQGEEQRQEEFELQQRNLELGLQELMKIPTCRLWMWSLLTRLGLFESSGIDLSAANPSVQAIYASAQADAARQIWLELAESAPNLLLVMQQECMSDLGEMVLTENTNRRRRRRRSKRKQTEQKGPGGEA